MDNKFFTFMSRVADLIILNVVFIVCCIPIVTIGASVTAMNYVTMKMARNEESYIVKSFFKSFRENFKQATIIWLILLVAGLLLGMDFRIVQQVESTGLLKVVTYGLYMVALIYAMVLSYIFPLLAKFDNTIKNTFKNAMLMSIRHLPFTIVILLVGFAPAIATLTIPIVLAYGLIVWIMVGFSLIAFLNSLMFVRIFDHYIPQEEDSLMEGSSDSSEH
ncbi:MAG: DUF624 domain-containing protein [Lachnospiraceae bacterium]|nr:DUF624 domain-containing protein [Lachnospiraceae bacterium]